MPYRSPICGIYCITTPNGSQYVGSSVSIRARWSGHRSALRKGKHRSQRLQMAWTKHGDRLAFSVLEECSELELNIKEQNWINILHPELNTTQFVSNVWANPDTRKKLKAIHNSPEWRAARSQIGRSPRDNWRAVECDDGRVFPCMAHAARAFGIKVAGIVFLANSQRRGRLGVRFKFAGEPWREVAPAVEQMRITKAANGTGKHTPETRAQMRLHRAGWKPSELAFSRALEASRCAVVATCLFTGRETEYASQRDAARVVHPENPRTAGSQINKVCSGVKRSAYGYTWRRQSRQKMRKEGVA